MVPLHTRPARRASGRVLRIGAQAGLVKASTGYGYQRIQRDSAAIAASLARDGHPFARPVPRRRYRLLDAVLLDVLRHEPVQLERAFARLFLDQPAARMLRFLDEDTGPGDELRLIAACHRCRTCARRPARHGTGPDPLTEVNPADRTDSTTLSGSWGGRHA